MDYSGMTVNERLVVSGYYKKFDRAVKEKDRKTVVLILEQVGLNKSSINDILRKYKFDELS